MSLLVLSLALGLPRARAHAQPARAQEAAPEADALLEQGNELYRSGKLRAAYQAYCNAWALRRGYDIAANLAVTELRLGMARAAAEHFADCVRRFPASGDKAQLAQVRQLFDEARKDVAAVVIKVSVNSAEVFVDGKSIGLAPLEGEVFVEPGSRTIVAKLAGYDDATQRIETAKGGAQTVTLALVASAQNGAQGAADAATGTPNNELPPSMTTSLPPDRPKATVIGGGLGATAALTIAGVAFALASQAKGDARVDLIERLGGRSACWPGNNPPPQCSDVSDLGTAQLNFRGLAIAGFTASGIVLGATLAYALWPRRAPEHSGSVRVLPLPSTRGGAVSVVGSF